MENRSSLPVFADKETEDQGHESHFAQSVILLIEDRACIPTQTSLNSRQSSEMEIKLWRVRSIHFDGG